MTADSGHHPADSTWAVAVYSQEDSGALGTGVVIDARRVLTCAHVCAGLIGEDGNLTDPLWVRFSRVRPTGPGGRKAAALGTQSGKVISVQLPEGGHDLAVLHLKDAVPTGVRAARLRRPVPEDLVGKNWSVFGFPERWPFNSPEGQPHGSYTYGTVGAALGDGFVRLIAGSPYGVEHGFSGAGLWSPDYDAVIGMIGTAFTGDDGDNRSGDAQAITMYQADLCFGAEGLAALGWSAEQAGEEAMSSWGWTLQDDPEYGRHWRPAARGVKADSEDGYRFRGRAAALTEITGWLGRGRPDRRPLVVTGSPGVGKSAVLGRVVTTADSALRAELPAADDAVKAVEGSVACAVHAKGKTARDVAREIARAASAQLPDEPSDLATAIGAAFAVHLTGRFNVVIDALDEAASPAEARLIVKHVVKKLLDDCAGNGVQVVVGSRRQDHGGTLLNVFGGSAVVIDLDAERYFRLEDLEAYALATLQQLGSERPGNPYADDKVARPLAARIAALSDKNFLVAWLVAGQHGLCDQRPADPEGLTYTLDVRNALNDFLGQIEGVAGVSSEDLLTALAYAEAPGLPIELWIAAVEALYGVRPQETQLDEFTQSAAANFLVESSQDSEPVFQLFHQALNDTLLDARARRAVKDQKAFTRAFLNYGRQVGWSSAPPYLLRSLSHHAQQAGMLDELLTDDEYLLHADLHRLTPLAVQSAENATAAGRQRTRLLRLTPYAASAGPQERRAMFSVTETLEKLGASFRADPGPAPYRARWSTVSTHAERVAQEGHTGGVGIVCPLVLGGKIRLVSGGDDEILRIWDPASGRQLKTLEGHAGQVKDLNAFTVEDGRTLLASAGTDAVVRIWDPATGEQQRILEGHVGTITTVCSFTDEDGRILLASAGTDAVVRIWDPATGEQQPILEGSVDKASTVCSFTDEDGRMLLASSGEDGKILVWDPGNGEVRNTLERRLAADEDDTSTIIAICAFTGTEERPRLASVSGGAEGEIGVWDPVSGHYQALDGGTTSGGAWQICSFTADGRVMLASAGSDDMLRIWDATTGQRQRMITASDEVWSVCAFPAGDGRTLLASSGLDPTIQIWDPATGKQRQALKGHSGAPWSVCSFPDADGRTLLASAGDLVRIWDPVTGQLHHSLQDSAGGVWSVCAFPADDGRTLLASAGADAIIRIWDPATGLLRQSLEGSTGKVWNVCAFPAGNGRTLLASSGLDVVRIWDPLTGRLLRTLEGHTGQIWDLCTLVTAGGKALLVSTGDDGMVRVWDPDTGRQQRAMQSATEEPNAVAAFTAEDGRSFVAIAEGDGTIPVLDLDTGELERTLAGHGLLIRSIGVFTLAGRTLLASCGDDGEVRVWDPAEEQILQAVPVHLTPNVAAAVDGVLVVGLTAGLLAIELNLPS